MQIKPIRTEEDYNAAKKLVDILADKLEASTEYQQLEQLVAFIEYYENNRG